MSIYMCIYIHAPGQQVVHVIPRVARVIHRSKATAGKMSYVSSADFTGCSLRHRTATFHRSRSSLSSSPWSFNYTSSPNDALHSTKLKISIAFPTILSSSRSPPASLPFDLSPPPIDHDFIDDLEVTEDEVSEDGIVETFDNDDEALDAVDNGVVVVDLSHYGRIRVSGEDRIQFLHNQTTANFECLQEGQGCETVFVTPTARTIDIANAWIMKSAITLVVSPGTCESLTDMLRKYIFFADKVEIQDITEQTCLFVLVGPNCNKVMEDLNLRDLLGQPYGSHRHYSVSGMPVTVAVGNVISREGFTLMTTPAAAGSIRKTLINLGAIPMGSTAWETLRIIQGRPSPGKELASEFNVLEAGLWNSISLNKGCYKGQETISRLITYDGVKQRLWGIHLSSPAEPGSPITVDGKKVGKLTSYAAGRNKSKHFGLGYIKRKAASLGDTVIVGENNIGTVVEVPFLAQQRPPSESLTT